MLDWINMEEYNNITLKNIEDAVVKILKESEPLFKVTRVSGTNMFKITTGKESIFCNQSLLMELDAAIRKELGLDQIEILKYEPLQLKL